jgi:hypothetical protein
VNILIIIIIGRAMHSSRASHRGVPSSNPGVVVWNFWWVKWHCGWISLGSSPVLPVLISPTAPLIILSLTVYYFDTDSVIK